MFKISFNKVGILYFCVELLCYIAGEALHMQCYAIDWSIYKQSVQRARFHSHSRHLFTSFSSYKFSLYEKFFKNVQIIAGINDQLLTSMTLKLNRRPLEEALVLNAEGTKLNE